MKPNPSKLSLLTALAVAAFSTGTLKAQTYTAITNLIFAEDFSTYGVGSMPTTEAAGGLWADASWLAVAGYASVITDDQNLFGQGTQNQFFRASSTYGVTLGSPSFFPQDVVIMEFDFIGHYPAGDGSRWLNVAIRTGTEYAHYTSPRINNATIRTATTDVPPNPSYGGNDKTIRMWTVMNNRMETIEYDRPDGAGTASLSATNASVWLYHYEASTWEHLLPEYNYSRTAASPTGLAIDNIRFILDSNAALRSFDVDNIKVYGTRVPLPTIHAGITNLLFMDDFNSYDVGVMPPTTATGGKWATANWQGTQGTAAVVEDVNNLFGLGVANRYLQISNTHYLYLITPVFQAQEVLSYAFDFVGHFYPDDTSRWMNVDARNATGAAHVTSLLMSATSFRGTSASYGPNDSPVRVLTVLNNREGDVTYDRPDGMGTATLAAGRVSLWIRAAGYDWEQVVEEYIYARTAGFPFGAVMDRLRIYLDSNAVFRSLDLDNVEVYGSIKPVPPAVALSAALAAGKVQVRWFGTAGSTYQVQYRTSLNAGEWTDLGAPIVAAADGEQTVEEDAAETARFYRIEQMAP